MPKAERTIGLLLIQIIRDLELIKRIVPEKEVSIDRIQFDVELTLLKFAHGKDVNFTEADARWAEELKGVLE